jgi:hypothetical protein
LSASFISGQGILPRFRPGPDDINFNNIVDAAEKCNPHMRFSYSGGIYALLSANGFVIFHIFKINKRR